jgi:hypothetical protein
MNQLVQQIYQWTLRHPAETVLLFLAAAVIKYPGDLLSECGPHIRFVLLVLAQTPSSTWGRAAVHPSGPRADTKRMPMCHRKRWGSVNHAVTGVLVVTNSSKTSTPARLLTAELLHPRVNHPTASCILFICGSGSEAYRREVEILSGETRKIYILFCVDLHLHRHDKPQKGDGVSTGSTAASLSLSGRRVEPLRPIEVTPKK